jgi:hypothetical protein
MKGIKAGTTKPSYSPAAAKAARTMSMKSIRHYASTKEKGLPEKVKKTQVASKENPFSFRDLIKKTRKRKKKKEDIMKELFPEEAQKG